MGGNQSAEGQKGQKQSSVTFPEILDTILKKVEELQETIKNMKRNRMEEGVARLYIRDILQTSEGEIRSLNSILLNKPTNTQHGYGGQERRDQERPRASPRRIPQAPETTDSVDVLQQRLQKTIFELSSLQAHFEQIRKEKDALKKFIDDQSKRNEQYKNDIQKLKDEKQSLFHRLSKLTSEKLTTENPNIADLSDPNRPTKLVEMMSELYDNEWTDAFEALQSCNEDNRKNAKILFDTFLDVFSVCKEKSAGLVSLTEQTVKNLFEATKETGKENVHARIGKSFSSTTIGRPQDKMQDSADSSKQNPASNLNVVFLEWRDKDKASELEDSVAGPEVEKVWPKLEDELKKLRKQFGLALVPSVTMAYLKPRWNKSCITALKPYIKKCIHVCWLMCVQSPPMVIVPPARRGETFDASLYSTYNTRGETVDFIVWPAVLLKEPKSEYEKLVLMRKGVAEGMTQ